MSGPERHPVSGEGLSDVQHAIAEHYDKLTAGQRKVIDRMLSDTRYAAVTSAPGLAAEIGVSESTITRAAQALGFAGYPDLQARLRDQFIGSIDKRVSNVSGLGKTPEEAAIQVMLEDAEIVRMTAEDLPTEALASATEMLTTARRIYVFAARGSHGIAQILGIGLRLLLPGTYILNQAGGDLEDQLIDIGPEDVLVAISFRRMDRIMVNVVRHAVSVRAKTIVISDHLSNPLSRHATITLTARAGPPRLMPSFAPAASLVNALVTAISLRTLESSAERLEVIEQIWDRFDTYIVD